MNGSALLEWLEEATSAHARLVEDSGGLVPAAHRIASAKAQVAHSIGVPSAVELHAAASILAERVEMPPIQSRKVLIEECRALGLKLLNE